MNSKTRSCYDYPRPCGFLYQGLRCNRSKHWIFLRDVKGGLHALKSMNPAEHLEWNASELVKSKALRRRETLQLLTFP